MGATVMTHNDMVDCPPHYASLNPEPITVIENWNLLFHLGNAIKYIARAGPQKRGQRD